MLGFNLPRSRVIARLSWNIWFTFSLSDFSYAFLSVLLEGVPFILIGTLLSGIIDEFLPSRVMVRFLPRNAFFGICLSGAMGLVFPCANAGVVPVIRRLINKACQYRMQLLTCSARPS